MCAVIHVSCNTSVLFDMQGPGTAILLFDSIQKTDEGQYICVAANEHGRTEESVEVTGACSPHPHPCNLS